MKDITIQPDQTIISAMKKIEQTGERSLIVVTRSLKFLGTLTDGDVRRNIIKGVNLKNKIQKIYKKNTIFLYENKFSESQVKKILIKQNNIVIPILNKKTHKYLSYLTWKSVFGENQSIEPIKNSCLVVMAGGKGRRLLPFTEVLPKPLIPVQGKPIIDHIIESFNKFGIEKIFMTLNYKSKILKSYFKSKNKKNYSIRFVEESQPLGTIGSLKLLKNYLPNNFFSINCDIIINHNLKEIYEFHRKNNNDLTIVTSMNKFELPYGVIETNSLGKLKNFLEKPSYNLFVNTGLYVFKKNILNYIPKNQEFDITKLIAKLKKEKKSIGVFPINQRDWYDVGQWTEYSKTNDLLKK